MGQKLSAMLRYGGFGFLVGTIDSPPPVWWLVMFLILLVWTAYVTEGQHPGSMTRPWGNRR